jgi:tRNA A-37 threonylcarbamoyl transferase component Bud32
MVFREQQTRWGTFGFSPEWSFHLAPIEAEGENAVKYLATFFSKEGQPQRAVFVKQYHHPQIDGAAVENEFCGIEIAHQAFQSTDRFRTPRPYSCRLGEKVLFMEYCPSVSLKRILFRPLRFSRFLLLGRDRERLLEYMIEAGRLLSHFQRIPLRYHPAGERETAEGIALRYEKQLLRHLGICRKGGFPEGLIQRIQSAVFHRLESQFSFPPIVLQHSDFAPWNLMVGDRHLYLTDFQNWTPGFSSFDLAFFHSALDLLYRYRTVDGGFLSQMQSVMVEAYLNDHEEAGFFRGGRVETKETLPLFEVFRFMHMTYFAQSIFCSSPGSYYQSLYAVPFRRFLIDWFHQHLEG